MLLNTIYNYFSWKFAFKTKTKDSYLLCRNFLLEPHHPEWYDGAPKEVVVHKSDRYKFLNSFLDKSLTVDSCRFYFRVIFDVTSKIKPEALKELCINKYGMKTIKEHIVYVTCFKQLLRYAMLCCAL